MILDGLGKRYKCTPVVFKEKRFFSIARLRFKAVARIVGNGQFPVFSRYDSRQ
jgi:hypothetical protein